HPLLPELRMGPARLPPLPPPLLAATSRAQDPPATPKLANPPLREESIDLDLSDPKAKPDPIIFVEPAEPYGDAKFEVVTGLLRRELYRQAFLLAARDEFGLTARDGALGEAPPADLAALTNRFRVTARSAVSLPREVAVAVGPPAASRTAWRAVAAGPDVVAEQPGEAVT